MNEQKLFRRRMMLSLALATSLNGPVMAVTNTWSAAGGSGDWFDSAKWSLGHVPTGAEDVFVTRDATIVGATTISFTGASAVAGDLNIDAPGVASDSISLILGSVPLSAKGIQLGTSTAEGTIILNATNGSVSQTDATRSLVVGEHGAWGEMNFNYLLSGAPPTPVTSTLTAQTLIIGRGYNESTFGRSTGIVKFANIANGTIPVTQTISIALPTIVGDTGGHGEFTIGDGTTATLSGLVTIGTGIVSDPLSPFLNGEGIMQVGDFSFNNGNAFDRPSAVVNTQNRMDIGILGGNGSLSVQNHGVVNLGVDASNISLRIGVGTNVSPDGQTQRSRGSVSISDSINGPTIAMTAAGDVQIGIDGGVGTLAVQTETDIAGKLIVGRGHATDTGLPIETNGYVNVGGSVFPILTVTGDTLVGQDRGIGQIDVGATGDGPYGVFNANYVELGKNDANGGTGRLNMVPQGTTNIVTLQMRLNSAPPITPGGTDYPEDRAGGFVQLNSGHKLSVVTFDADGEGNRFSFLGGEVVLNNGQIQDWGAHDFVIPEYNGNLGTNYGILSGKGTVLPNAINHGLIDVGFFDNPSSTFRDTITFNGNFTQRADYQDIYYSQTPRISLDIGEPTRISPNGAEKIIVNGTATLDWDLSANVHYLSTWLSDVQVGDTFDLLDFNGPRVGTFRNIYLPFLPEGFRWKYFGAQPLDYSNGHIVVEADAPAIAAQWNVNASGNWPVAGNWSGGVPSSVDDSATFGTIITAARTVTLSTDQIVNSLRFNNANQYTLAGPGSLTIASRTTGTVQVDQGSHLITAPFAMAVDTRFTITGVNNKLSITDFKDSRHTLEKRGAGELELNRMSAAKLDLQTGKVSLLSQTSPVAGADELEQLTINTVAGAQLDIRNHAMVIHSNDLSTSTRDSIQTLVTSGQNGFDPNGGYQWNGPGIVSSTARAANILAGVDVQTVAVVSNHDLARLAADGGSCLPYDASFPWLGAVSNIGTDDILIRTTYAGDTNLDGTVTIDDYNNIDGTFTGLLPNNYGWVSGDFDFNGTITIDDYNAIDTGFLYQGGQLTQSMIASRTAMFGTEYVAHLEQLAASFASVPEPTMLAVLGLGAAGLLSRRRGR